MKKVMKYVLGVVMFLSTLPMSGLTTYTVYEYGEKDGKILKVPSVCHIVNSDTKFFVYPEITWEYDEETGESIQIENYEHGTLYNNDWEPLCLWNMDVDIVFQESLEEVAGIEVKIKGETAEVSWQPVVGANYYLVKMTTKGVLNIDIPLYQTKYCNETKCEFSDISGIGEVTIQPFYQSDESRENLRLFGIEEDALVSYYDNMGECSDGVAFTASINPPEESETLNNLGIFWYNQQGNASGVSARFMNGEPWMSRFFGEIIGSDYFSSLYGPINNIVMNMEFMRDGEEYWMPYFGWCHPRQNILVATTLLNQYKENGWTSAKVEGQAYAMRAYEYLRLMEIFGPRWEDSENGNLAVLPEFLPEDYTPVKPWSYYTEYVVPTSPEVMSNLKTVNEIKGMIYSDLDKAIELMAKAGEIEEATLPLGTKRNLIPLDAIKGVYARAAMLFHDYDIAMRYAQEARTNHPLMTSEEYLGGFVKANNEWIWQLDGEGLYYWQEMSVRGCNGPYPCIWGTIGAGAINYDLYRLMEEKDCRSKLFWTPDKPLYRGVNKSSFWNTKVINETDMDLNGKNTEMVTSIRAYCIGRCPNTTWPGAYEEVAGASERVMVQFGAQFKFWGDDSYGHSQVPMMRGAEMLLTEAEAAFELGDQLKALQLLNMLNASRIADYQNVDISGEELRDAIRNARRIELWGEGFCWFDLKRWNLPMTRRPWIADDTSSNNIPMDVAVTIQPTDFNGWRCVLPKQAYYQAPQSASPQELKENNASTQVSTTMQNSKEVTAE